MSTAGLFPVKPRNIPQLVRATPQDCHPEIPCCQQNIWGKRLCLLSLWGWGYSLFLQISALE